MSILPPAGRLSSNSKMKAVAWTLAALALGWAAASTARAVQAAPTAEGPKAFAPKPARLPDGHPNWTGFWVPPGGMLEVYRGPSGVTAPGLGPNTNTNQTRNDGPALKSPYREQYAETQKKNAQGLLPDMVALCFPPGMPGMMIMIYGMEILQTPNIISITSEWQAETRRIWMDVKAHPPAEELDPTYAGHSIGHWEGDTLVVDTVGVRDDVTLDMAQTPHSPNMRIIERFTQSKPGILTDEVTVLDPEVSDTPRKYTHVYRHRPDLRLQEYNCLENNRNVDPETGQAAFKQ
jgi:hypothetical protein